MNQYRHVIETVCNEIGLSPNLVEAVIAVETSGLKYATRYEVGFGYLVEVSKWAKQLGITEITECIGQKTSWGLMQIMGATAREMGFSGYFPELCSEEYGIRFGAKYLKRQLDRFKTVENAIAAYNAGSPRINNGKFENQHYVDKVLSHLNKLGGI